MKRGKKIGFEKQKFVTDFFISVMKSSFFVIIFA